MLNETFLLVHSNSMFVLHVDVVSDLIESIKEALDLEVNFIQVKN